MLRCDNDNIQIEVDRSTGIIYLTGLTYSAMDYASHKRADVTFDLEVGHRQPLSYSAGIHDVDYDRDALVLKVSTSSSLHQFFSWATVRKASAHFNINHHYYRLLHEAIEYANSNVLSKLVPSTFVRPFHHANQVQIRGRRIHQFHLDGKYQLAALRQMLTCNPDAPYLLLGPFGTGKTYVLAAAVTKLLESVGNRVLVCTHLNRGADGLCKNLHKHAPSIVCKAVRMVPSEEAKLNLRLPQNFDITLSSNCINSQWCVIITTFGTALHLAESVKQGQMSFTHILIDEGAQCPEPEALGAIVLASKETKVVIVGDNKQVYISNLGCILYAWSV